MSKIKDHHLSLAEKQPARITEFGTSLLTQLEDIKQLPKLVAGGSLGQLSTEGKIETTLRLEREV
ncbi:MAG: hypothetical protein J7L25_02730 [Deltaproteobacteria bacterium]|nr:hypothetical protein [Candidatus Tharpella aukensis]